MESLKTVGTSGRARESSILQLMMILFSISSDVILKMKGSVNYPIIAYIFVLLIVENCKTLNSFSRNFQECRGLIVFAHSTPVSDELRIYNIRDCSIQ